MINITEDYCDFETSKLLKEKGFIANDRIYKAYNLKNKSLINSDGNFNYDTEIPAPTHQMAMKWLRSKGIVIVIRNKAGEVGYSWYDLELNSFYWVIYPFYHGIKPYSDSDKTYEEAVEEAIKYVLTNDVYIKS